MKLSIPKGSCETLDRKERAAFLSLQPPVQQQGDSARASSAGQRGRELQFAAALTGEQSELGHLGPELKCSGSLPLLYPSPSSCQSDINSDGQTLRNLAESSVTKSDTRTMGLSTPAGGVTGAGPCHVLVPQGQIKNGIRFL